MTLLKKYDVIIIGAGPAGIFTALELYKSKKDLKILIIEKGRDIYSRACPMKKGTNCLHCAPCSIVSGWGGAGAYSDGKLTLTTEFGGILDQYISKTKFNEFIKYIDKVYLQYGATQIVHGTDSHKVKELQKKAATADLKLVPAIVKHLGTDKCFNILKDMRDFLENKVDIETLDPVSEILVNDNKVIGVKTKKEKEYLAEYVVAVPGRDGAEWFAGESNRLKLTMAQNPVDIGVRVEVPAVVLEHFTDVIYESKLIFYSKHFDDKIRTFCMNPYGEVVVENNDGLKIVNGHSYADKKTENTNFALLVSNTFTEPFKEPISYGKYVATLANMLGGGVMVQRLGDLIAGRRSTVDRINKGLVVPTLKDATPGDLSLVFPYRHLMNIVEMLEAMDKVAPGIYSRHTLLYGVEVKFYSSRLKLSENLETEISNLFAAGDGAGVTRGLAQASISGVIVAREILNRLNK